MREPLAVESSYCPVEDAAMRTPSRLLVYLALSKARLTALVLATTAVGYILACPRPLRWGGMALTLLGTGLAAAGANALNQLLEVDRDAKMRRTCRRPLPAGHVSRWHAFLFGLATVAIGLGVLNEFVNPLTAALGLVNVATYTLLYTPLKPRTSLNTLVGAVCGALPPVMGWTGAGAAISLGALAVAAILFTWQIPHFLALAWLYREDYARGGYRMLPGMDPGGRLTCLLIVLYTLALLPLGLVVTFVGICGYLFAMASLLLGLGLFLLSVRLFVSRTAENARRMFLASVVYLSLILLLMAVDASREGQGQGQGQPQPSNAAAATGSSAALVTAEPDGPVTAVSNGPVTAVSNGPVTAAAVQTAYAPAA